VVAYAFRDHWMWFNGYSYIGRIFSFVIWKDYNCVAWITVGNSVINGVTNLNILGTNVGSALNYLKSNNLIVDPYNDIWTIS
jgi:hypothetical protein